MCDIANLEAHEKNWKWMKCLLWIHERIYEDSSSEVCSLWSTVSNDKSGLCLLSQHFKCTSQFSPQSWEIGNFCKWGNWVTENLKILSKVTQAIKRQSKNSNPGSLIPERSKVNINQS